MSTGSPLVRLSQNCTLHSLAVVDRQGAQRSARFEWPGSLRNTGRQEFSHALSSLWTALLTPVAAEPGLPLGQQGWTAWCR